MIDGPQKRYQKSYDLLLENIEQNTAVKTASADFQLINDGVSWKLANGNEELGNAIFGTLATTPVEEDSESAE